MQILSITKKAKFSKIDLEKGTFRSSLFTSQGIQQSLPPDIPPFGWDVKVVCLEKITHRFGVSQDIQLEVAYF